MKEYYGPLMYQYTSNSLPQSLVDSLVADNCHEAAAAAACRLTKLDARLLFMLRESQKAVYRRLLSGKTGGRANPDMPTTKLLRPTVGMKKLCIVNQSKRFSGAVFVTDTSKANTTATSMRERVHFQS